MARRRGGSYLLTPAAPLAMEGSNMSMNPSMIRNSSSCLRRGYFFRNSGVETTVLILVILPTEAQLFASVSHSWKIGEEKIQTHVSLTPTIFPDAFTASTIISLSRSMPADTPGKLYSTTGSGLRSATSTIYPFRASPPFATSCPA